MNFSMEVVNEDVLKQEIVEQTKPEPEEVTALRKQAESNASEIMAMDLASLDGRKNVVKAIDGFGIDTMQTSAKKNELLQTSVGNISKTGGEGSAVANSLMELHREIKDLDPSLIDFTKTGLLGKLFNPIRSYFEKYEKADDVIHDIVESLDKGQKTLKNDNTTLEIEEVAMRDLTKKLGKEIEMGLMMDDVLAAKIEEAKSQNLDADKIRFVTEEVLFPLRQRVMDLQQMQLVNQQGIMAIEVVRRNNKELIRGVERAKTVTISAMRIAAIVASALYNQKIVLKKIEMLNATTNQLISGTSKMLKEQGAEIHKQSIEANISVDTLKTAFSDAIEAMDAISTYKQEALPKMRATIDQFRELAVVGEKQIQRLEKSASVEL